MKAELRLYEMMARNNIRTIAELRKKTNLSRTTIGEILNGKKKSLNLHTIGILCKTLDCKIEELIVLKEAE